MEKMNPHFFWTNLILAGGLLLAVCGVSRPAGAGTAGRPGTAPGVVELRELLPEMESGSFAGVRGVPILYGGRRPAAGRESVATVVIVNGRNESFVKYRGLIAYLVERGFVVWSYDHRGQGFSGRLLADPEKGHVEDFADYAADLETFLRCVVRAEPERCFLLAHSMGGTIALLHELRFPGRVKALALCSPMLGFSTAPWPARLVPPLLSLLEMLGYGRDYIIGGGPFEPEPFTPDNVLTSNRESFAAWQRLVRQHPRLRLGAPTNHWVKSALAAIREISARAGELKIPILLLQAGADRVVDNRASAAFCRNCPACRLERVAGARHEILMEQPASVAAARRLILDFFHSYCHPAYCYPGPAPGERKPQ